MILGKDGKTIVSIRVSAGTWIDFKSLAILMQKKQPQLKINDVMEIALREFVKRSK